MRRMIHPAHVVAFVGFFGLVMAIGLLLKDYATQASLQQVRAAVQQGAEYDAQTAADTELEGIEMPSWDRWGWTLTGGRTDQLEDRRDALTGFYRDGANTITYTVIAGDGPVNDDLGDERNEGLSAKVTIDDHTVVLTAWPASERLAIEFGEMARRALQ